MKKLSKKELEEFSAARNEYFNLKEKLADIVISEERIKTDKQTTLMNVNMAHDSLMNISKLLQDKYGQGKINLQTGEIKS